MNKRWTVNTKSRRRLKRGNWTDKPAVEMNKKKRSRIFLKVTENVYVYDLLRFTATNQKLTLMLLIIGYKPSDKSNKEKTPDVVKQELLNSLNESYDEKEPEFGKIAKGKKEPEKAVKRKRHEEIIKPTPREVTNTVNKQGQLPKKSSKKGLWKQIQSNKKQLQK